MWSSPHYNCYPCCPRSPEVNPFVGGHDWSVLGQRQGGTQHRSGPARTLPDTRPRSLKHHPLHTTQIPTRLTGDCEGVRGAMPQLSWVLGEPGGLGMGDRSGLEPAKRGQITVAQSG